MGFVTLFLITIHLGWAYLLNFLLKFIVITSDNIQVALVEGNQFIVVYFVVLAIYYMGTVNDFNNALRSDPVTTSAAILKVGLDLQNKDKL